VHAPNTADVRRSPDGVGGSIGPRIRPLAPKEADVSDGLYLGTRIDDDSRVHLDPDHLTTHAVCLGMTGSGKTGLGIVAMEELARRGTPLLVIDLKGDMTNLLLNFPDLDPASFRPWLPPDALSDGDTDEVAASRAALWSKGLAGSGLGGADLRAVRSGVSWQLFTPGVASGAPLSILPSLGPPEGVRLDDDPDGVRQRVDGVTAALLSLIDRGGDPLADPDHVLLASIILEVWRRGTPLDLAGLLTQLMDPPIERLGVLPLETVYPRAKRMELVMALNTLIASPAFAAWTQGVPMTMDHLLGTARAPRASIVSVAHLGERQRHFVISLLGSELIAWMRRQPASSGLRALLYIDEVQGILPPHPANPPTKGPLLTLLKQGRAFGVGVWLATQNPVDLDYKALGNAGVKMVGRLLTDRDRERALEGLGFTASEESAQVEAAVSTLAKRQFVLHDVRESDPVQVFGSRWAMSYLRGPLTLAEMVPLLTTPGERAAHHEPAPAPSAPPLAASAAPRPPMITTPVDQVYTPADGDLEPVAVIRVGLTVERKGLNLLRTIEERWLLPFTADGSPDWERAEVLERPPEMMPEPSPDARFPEAAPPKLDAALRTLDREFIRFRARTPVEFLANTALDVVRETGESADAFRARCLELADRADDAREEKVRTRFEKRIATVRRRLERETEELSRDRAQAEARKAEERLGMVEGLFSVLLGSRSMRTAAGKLASKARSTATKRRMSAKAHAAVEESENEILRLEEEMDILADDMEDELAALDEAAQEVADTIESVAVRPYQKDIVIRDLVLFWREA
jgi:hypothetical protein